MMPNPKNRARAPPQRGLAPHQHAHSSKEQTMITPGFLVLLSAAVQHFNAGREEVVAAVVPFLVRLLSL
jgi:hypothetical protein